MKVLGNLYGCRPICKLCCVALLLAGLAVITVVPSASALDSIDAYAGDHHNKAIISAFSHMKEGQWEAGRKMLAGKKDPLAARLFFWLSFQENNPVDDSETAEFIHLVQFIRRNPDWPYLGAMTRKAEETMPDNLRMADVIAWFDDFKPRTAVGMDRYLQALILSGKSQQARDFLANWWSTTLLDRDGQKALYRKYRTFLTREAHIGRLDYLLLNGHFTNGRAIAELLGTDYEALTEARIALASGGSGVNALIARVPDHLHNDPGLQYERLRWRRKKDLNSGAMDILHNAPDYEDMANPKEWWRERHILIRRMIEEKKFDTAYKLAAGHKQKEGFPMAQAEFLTGWLALRFMRDPHAAFTRFKNLYENVSTPISRARGAYWAGRAAEAYGQPHIAARWYKAAARYSNVFYGQTAAAELSMSGAMPAATVPTVTAAQSQAYMQEDFVRAALWLHEAGFEDEAGAFLDAFVEQKGQPAAYRFAADLAVALGAPHLALRVAKSADQKGMFMLVQSYPLLEGYMNEVGVDIEWALVHALIRQESMFNTNARSPVGARGLMQLMPATAEEVARRAGVRHNVSWLTQRPSHNILLGTNYLRQLLIRYDGYYPFAIAAYNAGPNRIDRWIVTYGDPRTGAVSLLDWIEMIPIYETRNYVQRVLEATYIYRLRLKNHDTTARTSLHVSMPYP